LESYKANFCIFFHDKYDTSNIYIENYSAENQNKVKKLLNAVYVALKGDLCSSPDFDTAVNISMTGGNIVLSITSDDSSKFRATALSILRLIDLVYRTIFINY
jgi:tRNA threonylcarbamoyladenosine modification (KEOPS) complex  Pcc1 subunit